MFPFDRGKQQESLQPCLNQPPVAYLGGGPFNTPFHAIVLFPNYGHCKMKGPTSLTELPLPTWVEDLTFGSALSPLVEGAGDDGVGDLSPIAPCGTIRWTPNSKVSPRSHGLAKQKGGHGPLYNPSLPVRPAASTDQSGRQSPGRCRRAARTRTAKHAEGTWRPSSRLRSRTPTAAPHPAARGLGATAAAPRSVGRRPARDPALAGAEEQHNQGQHRSRTWE